jgi:hypothetical protein
MLNTSRCVWRVPSRPTLVCVSCVFCGYSCTEGSKSYIPCCALLARQVHARNKGCYFWTALYLVKCWNDEFKYKNRHLHIFFKNEIKILHIFATEIKVSSVDMTFCTFWFPKPPQGREDFAILTARNRRPPAVFRVWFYVALQGAANFWL